MEVWNSSELPSSSWSSPVSPPPFRGLRNDGRGHTPPVRSEDAWSALDLPSTSYTLRIF